MNRTDADTDASDDTAADRREFLEAGLTEVGCDRCGAGVRVRKVSADHTSVQWDARAQQRCTAFDLRTGCSHLRDGIDRAVAEGRLPLASSVADQA